MRNSYNFWNTLIGTFYKSITRSFIILKAMIENEIKVLLIFNFFSEIMLAEHGACNHDVRKKIKILVKVFYLSI